MLNDEIKQAVKTIYDRTGLLIPDIFYLEENEKMKKRWTIRGTYDPLSHRISLRPSLFIPVTDVDYYTKLLNRWYKEYDASGATPEQVAFFMQEQEKSRRQDNQITIIHECGHYIHNIYFYNKGMRIPYDAPNITQYARKNCLENFATAFTSYVLKLIPIDCKRYQKMESLIEECRERQSVRSYN